MPDAAEPDAPAVEASASSERLERIAALLGCPVEAFYEAPDANPPAGTVELLRLWCAISDEAGRARVLACARAAAGAAHD